MAIDADDPFASVPTPVLDVHTDDGPPAWLEESAAAPPPARRSVWPPALANREAEFALIGELLLDPRVIDDDGEKLHPRDFSDEALGLVFGRLLQEAAAGREPTHQTLAPLLAREEAFQAAGGGEMLARAFREARGLHKGGPYADQIAALARRRRFATDLQGAVAVAQDLGQDHTAAIGAADTALTAYVEQRDAARLYSAGDCVDYVLAEFDRPRTGVKCGVIPELDELLGAQQPGDMTVVAGRPGMGKTAVAVSYMRGAATLGHASLFISCEMGVESGLGARLVCDHLCQPHGGVPFAIFSEVPPTYPQRRMVMAARESIERLPIRIQDRSCNTIAQIRRAIRRRKRELEAVGQKLELVVVDYLQLITPDHRTNSEYEAVTEVSRSIKAMAKDEAVVMMVLSQLNRAVEAREDKRPRLADLRQSGQIEQDADAVVMLYSPEYYLMKDLAAAEGDQQADLESQLTAVRHLLEFLCLKRRRGPEGMRAGMFFRETQAVRGRDFYEQGGR